MVMELASALTGGRRGRTIRTRPAARHRKRWSGLLECKGGAYEHTATEAGGRSPLLKAVMGATKPDEEGLKAQSQPKPRVRGS